MTGLAKVCHANQRRADSLNDCGNNVTCEDGSNGLFRQRRILPAQSIDHDSDDGGNGGREENESDDNEEVLNDEEGH